MISNLSLKLMLFSCVFCSVCQQISLQADDTADQITRKRNIYLDLGSFQGKTLTLFSSIGVKERGHKDVPWEVFSFEPCPLLAHSVQLVCDDLNKGETVDAVSGFSDVASLIDCFTQIQKNGFFLNSKTRRLLSKYEKIVMNAVSSAGTYEELLSKTYDDLQHQLDEAKTPSTGSKDTFTAYACGVGPANTISKLKWYETSLLTGGPSFFSLDNRSPKYTFQAPLINLSEWILNSFSKDDYIYIKMDVGGMECLLLQSLVSSGALEYIDEMDIMWHNGSFVPGKQKELFYREALDSHQVILRDHNL